MQVEAGQTWKTLRPLGDDRQVTERWSTRSKAWRAQGPKINFNLKHMRNNRREQVTHDKKGSQDVLDSIFLYVCL